MLAAMPGAHEIAPDEHQVEVLHPDLGIRAADLLADVRVGRVRVLVADPLVVDVAHAIDEAVEQRPQALVAEARRRTAGATSADSRTARASWARRARREPAGRDRAPGRSSRARCRSVSVSTGKSADTRPPTSFARESGAMFGRRFDAMISFGSPRGHRRMGEHDLRIAAGVAARAPRTASAGSDAPPPDPAGASARRCAVAPSRRGFRGRARAG